MAEKHFIDIARKMVRYYENCVRESGPIWQPGLDAAHEWQEMLVNGANSTEIRDFVDRLHQYTRRDKSAWSELIYWISRWASECKKIDE